MPFTLDHALHHVATAPEGYVAAYGALSFDAARFPIVDWRRQQDVPPVTRISARLKGESLTRQGFTATFDRAVFLDVRCAGPWCPSAPLGKIALVFLKQEGTGLSVHIGPCSSHVFHDPSRVQLERVKRCYLKGDCPEP